MTLAQKHGFTFQNVVKDSVVVAIFREKWLVEHGYPPNLVNLADNWVAVMHGVGVYCLFGWRSVTPRAIEITDFYVYPGRRGKLAAEAALERIKNDADRTGFPVTTGVASWNTTMEEAFKKRFGVSEPDVKIYRYNPPAQAVSA